MKKLIILAILGTGGYFLAMQVGIISKEDTEAVVAYKLFANAYVAKDYEKALSYATGGAEEELKERITSRTMNFMGRKISVPGSEKAIIERANFTINAEQESSDGNTITIRAVQSASISWPGMTANPASPKSYTHFDQTAVVINMSGIWKVTQFSSTTRNRN